MDEIHRVTTEDNLIVAINQADEGDTLVLEKGYHTIDSPIDKDADYVTLVGRGRDNTIVRQSDDFPLVKLVGMQRRGDRCTGWQFRDLTLQSGKETSSSIVHARYGGTHSFENVHFDSANSFGNGVFAEECWEVRFTNCGFSSGGKPGCDSSAVYLYNGDYDMSNSFYFLNCTWREITSHALYSDSSGKGMINDRIYIANSKFRGYGRGGRIAEDPNQYYIDGTWNELKITNSHFKYSLRGFLRNLDRGRALQVSNCSFEEYGDVALDLQSTDSIIANNVFLSDRRESQAIRSEGSGTRIVGNRISDFEGMHVSGEDTGVHSNYVTGTSGDGIVLAGDRCLASANAVRNADGHAILVRGDTMTIHGNSCVNAARDGIRLDDAAHSLVTDNVVRSVGECGIRSSGDSDYLLLDDNLITAAEADGVSLVGTHNGVGTQLVD